jgi:pteridine reductase
MRVMSELAKSTRVVLVTGGARRVGAAIVRELYRHGCAIALHHHRSRAEAEALAAELAAPGAPPVVPFAADLGAEDACRRLAEAVLERFGRLDGLVNNASLFYPTPCASLDPSDFDRLMAVNARAPLLLALALAPALSQARGAIVNLGDVFGLKPLPRFLAYSASKAALLMITQGLARELAPEVRVNAVLPGTVLPSELPEKAESAEAVASRAPLARLGTPEEVASAVRFLLLEASYTTGALLPVDGGRLSRI